LIELWVKIVLTIIVILSVFIYATMVMIKDKDNFRGGGK